MRTRARVSSNLMYPAEIWTFIQSYQYCEIADVGKDAFIQVERDGE
jgi:hypothetical protein